MNTQHQSNNPSEQPTTTEGAASGVLPVVPVASHVRTSYFRDHSNPERVLTLVRRRALGFVEVGWAMNRPVEQTPFEGRLYKRSIVHIKPEERRAQTEEEREVAATLEAALTGEVVDGEDTRQLSRNGNPIDEFYYQFEPVWFTGFVSTPGDVFCKREGRRIAIERLNDEFRVVRVMPREGESVLHAALRGLAENTQYYSAGVGHPVVDLVPHVVRLVATETLGWVEEQEQEVERAKQEDRKPFWGRLADNLRKLVGG